LNPPSCYDPENRRPIRSIGPDATLGKRIGLHIFAIARRAGETCLLPKGQRSRGCEIGSRFFPNDLDASAQNQSHGRRRCGFFERNGGIYTPLRTGAVARLSVAQLRVENNLKLLFQGKPTSLRLVHPGTSSLRPLSQAAAYRKGYVVRAGWHSSPFRPLTHRQRRSRQAIIWLLRGPPSIFNPDWHPEGQPLSQKCEHARTSHLRHRWRWPP
jgi:hypothetical protein